MNQVIPLSLLAIGEKAEVLTVSGLPEQTRRLGELGFREGVSIEMVQPGTPCIVRLETSKFCFRESEVSSVLVRTRTTG